MSKLISKARSGVTLVELLVVILIVTILSVSMLPLLQPFVVESQYAAEPIPVIGNLRTKISLYQYDKGQLPGLLTNGVANIETWVPVSGTTGQEGSKVNSGESDLYGRASCAFAGTTPSTYWGAVKTDDNPNHIGKLCNIDYQDLKGKRSKPNHYQYLLMMNGSDYAFFVGCFGDGNGLKTGTGYAVCEIVAKGHKVVGTWKRYKPVSGTSAMETAAADRQICFTTSKDKPQGADGEHLYGCFVPEVTKFTQATSADGELSIVSELQANGWEF